jgi:hypothetical protein
MSILSPGNHFCSAAGRALVALLLLLVPSTALAQTRFELTPYAGWRHGNDVRDVSGTAVEFDSGVAYGFMVDVAVTRNLYAEFIYSYRKTSGSAFVPPEAEPFMGNGTIDFEGNLDYYQAGVLYQFETRYTAFWPYLVASIGAASLRSDGGSTTNLAGTLGGGLKYMLSDNIGLRAEYRLFVTDTDFVGRGGWCDWWGFCYSTIQTRYLYQSQLAGGVIIGF